METADEDSSLKDSCFKAVKLLTLEVGVGEEEPPTVRELTLGKDILVDFLIGYFKHAAAVSGFFSLGAFEGDFGYCLCVHAEKEVEYFLFGVLDAESYEEDFER